LEFGEPGELKSCKCNLPECGRGIAYGCDCCGRVQKFGSEIIFQAGSYPEFDYFKKFQVFDFLKSLALAKSCRSQNEIWREDFFKSVCSCQKILKSCSRLSQLSCSRQKLVKFFLMAGC
jgi:hypothetical protein